MMNTASRVMQRLVMETRAGIGTAVVEFQAVEEPVHHAGYVMRDEIKEK